MGGQAVLGMHGWRGGLTKAIALIAQSQPHTQRTAPVKVKRPAGSLAVWLLDFRDKTSSPSFTLQKS